MTGKLSLKSLFVFFIIASAALSVFVANQGMRHAENKYQMLVANYGIPSGDNRYSIDTIDSGNGPANDCFLGWMLRVKDISNLKLRVISINDGQLTTDDLFPAHEISVASGGSGNVRSFSVKTMFKFEGGHQYRNYDFLKGEFFEPSIRYGEDLIQEKLVLYCWLGTERKDQLNNVREMLRTSRLSDEEVLKVCLEENLDFFGLRILNNQE